MLPALLVVALLLSSAQFGGAKGSCKIKINPKSKHQPLLIDIQKKQLYYPAANQPYNHKDGSSIVSIHSGTTFMVACPSTRNTSAKNERYVRSYCLCVGKVATKVGEDETSTCSLPNVTRTDNSMESKPDCEGSECNNCLKADTVPSQDDSDKAKTTYSIGWDIEPGLFIPIIDIYFNRKTETTLYTKHKLWRNKECNANIKTHIQDEDKFSAYTRIKEMYKKENQEQSLKTQLGQPFPQFGKEEIFLSKGHLAPCADFYYATEQDATYSYLNLVPQWQILNSGNWQKLENAIRKLAKKRPNLIVWTGTNGTLQLPTINNNEVSIFLAPQNSRVPVPAIMWKAVLDPDTKRAVAIVMINSVEKNDRAVDHLPIHQSLNCNNIKWLKWNSERWIPKLGRIFCFQVGHLIRHSVIPKIPELNVKDVLKSR